MRTILFSFLVIFLTSCGSSKKAAEAQEQTPLSVNEIQAFVEQGFTYMEVVTIKNPQPCDFLLSDRKGNLYEVKIGLEELRKIETTHILVKYDELPASEAECTGTKAIDLMEMKLLD